jgi:hypothetical protein
VAGWINGIETPPLFPKSGGGSATCCLDVPKKWKPGMKMTVYWKYGTDSDEAAPHSAVVDIPEYAPNRNGRVHVHFYPDDKVRVVVTRYYLGHPYYPLPKAEWTTWELHENAVIGEEWDKERGEPPPPKIERIWGKQWGVNLYND